MQLPRGTFRELKRGYNLHSLIREMEGVCFSGYCKILSDKVPLLLVFSDGKIVLAEYGTLVAHAAMEEISHTRDKPVDGLLHELSFAQIKLALEFNPSARVDGGEKPADLYTVQPQPRRDAPTGKPKSPAVLSDNAPHRVTVPGSSRDPLTSVPVKDEEITLLIQDLDALDALDIQAMAKKFRMNCRQMIEKLELEHLLDKNAGEGEP
ncbi:MAG TPA: hypothetical protein PLN56_10290 [Methanoregulaceae archaeon]|nr:hypothetical protein [Methanoregulaceae archaeon]HPD11365.1 hypothetical protein [Methanoregulaceae archaeon]